MKVLFSLAFNNLKEIIRQPFYYILLLAGCFVIFMSFMFTFFAFGEEMRMIKDMAISTITVCGLLAGILSSSVLITNEFKRKTILALLSKPITKIQIILGKYFGIITAVVILIATQGIFLEILIGLDTLLGFSNIEHHADSLHSTHLIDYYCLQGVYFSLLQILMLTSISLVLSIYLNVTANLIICFLVFILSHIITYAFPFCDKTSATVSFFIKTLYMIFPSFSNLNIFAVNSVASECVTLYIFYSSLYSLMYCAIVIYLAIICFKRKEIL